MARPRQGKQCLLQIQLAGATDWLGIAWETEHSLASSTESSETVTKRGRLFSNASTSYTIATGAVTDDDPNTGEVSTLDVLNLQESGDRFKWRRVFISLDNNGEPEFENAIFYMGGIGTFSNVNEAANVSDNMTWTANINNSGFLYKSPSTAADIPDITNA